MNSTTIPEAITNRYKLMQTMQTLQDHHIYTHQDIPAITRLQIRSMKGLSDQKGIASVLSTLLMYAIAGFLFYQNSMLAGSIMMGLAMIRGAFLMHDASHGTLMNNRILNHIGGMICGTPVVTSLSNYRVSHMQHHRYVRSDIDPGNLELAAKKLGVPLGAVYCFTLLFGAPMFILLSIVTMPIRVIKEKRFDVLGEYLVIALFFYFFIYAAGISHFLHMWVIPFAITSLVMNIRNFTEHEFTGAPESTFTSTRTVLSNRLVRWLMHNENYHIEHHLYPDLPSFELPKLHRMLEPTFEKAGSIVSKGYISCFRDIFRQVHSS